MIVKCTRQIAVSILLLFALFMDVKAQTPSFDCPSDFNPSTWIEHTEEIKLEIRFPAHENAIWWQVLQLESLIPPHYVHIKGNDITVLIDWSTFDNQSKPLSDETVKELMLMRLAREYNKTYGFECVSHHEEIFTIKFVSQAQCSVTTSCLSLLKYNDEIPCLQHPELEQRIIRNNLTGEGYWRQFRTKPCGFKCCLLVLKMKCKRPYSEFTFLPKEYQSTSECPISTLEECPIPNQNPSPPPKILPCIGDCEKGELK
jgi:hypothetical protein